MRYIYPLFAEEILYILIKVMLTDKIYISISDDFSI